MARKTYSEEFRQQEVDLYLNTPGATFKAIAADLGISRGTLQNWVYAQHPTGRPTPAPATGTPPKGETAAARIARLEADLAAEQAERRKLETERDILRQAAKYFAGETNWWTGQRTSWMARTCLSDESQCAQTQLRNFVFKFAHQSTLVRNSSPGCSSGRAKYRWHRWAASLH